MRTSSTLAYGTVYSWFTLSDIAPLAAAECHAGNLVAAIRRAAASCPVNQRALVGHLFAQLELSTQQMEGGVQVALPEGGELALTFDARDRIRSMLLDGQPLPAITQPCVLFPESFFCRSTSWVFFPRSSAARLCRLP